MKSILSGTPPSLMAQIFIASWLFAASTIVWVPLVRGEDLDKNLLWQRFKQHLFSGAIIGIMLLLYTLVYISV